jgi:RNA polymerase sigma factor (sigma-70 family)
MNDQQIIKAIRSGENQKPIKQLYKEFPKVKTLILKSGGSADIAQEIFNDSLVLLIEKLQQPDFELTSKLTTYLYGINRFLMKNELRKQNKTNYDLEWSDTLIISQEDLEYDFEKEEKLNYLEKVLDTISEKCKQIFRLFYYQKESMESIAKRLEFSSVNSAKTQKYKCIEKASKIAQQMTTSNTNF